MTVEIVRSETSEAIELISPEQSRSAQIKTTSHPVEQGANVVDHAQSKLDSLKIQGVVAGSPLVRPELNVPSSPEAALDFLERAEEQPVQVITERIGSFRQALLESYAPRDTTGGSLEIQISVREVRFAQLETVALPSVEQDVGQQPTEPRSDAAQQPQGGFTPVPEANTDAPTDKEVGGSWASSSQTVR